MDEKNRSCFANDQALQLLNLLGKDVIDRYAPDVAVNNDLLRS
jgi:hypothetical protein